MCLLTNFKLNFTVHPFALRYFILWFSYIDLVYLLLYQYNAMLYKSKNSKTKLFLNSGIFSTYVFLSYSVITLESTLTITVDLTPADPTAWMWMFQTSVPEAADRSRYWEHASDRHINTAGCCHPHIDRAPAKTKPHSTRLTAAPVKISSQINGSVQESSHQKRLDWFMYNFFYDPLNKSIFNDYTTKVLRQ